MVTQYKSPLGAIMRGGIVFVVLLFMLGYGLKAVNISGKADRTPDNPFGVVKVIDCPEDMNTLKDVEKIISGMNTDDYTEEEITLFKEWYLQSAKNKLMDCREEIAGMTVKEFYESRIV
ncbi:MAG: hypothetical protein KKF89_02920 [Nanoarchaeota archaeon]|nr:hypothetical protein [Nanoarchaeota archaeon]